MPVSRLADSMSLLVGGERVGKYTDRGRRYDVRVRMQLQERSSPDDLKLMTLRAGDKSLVNVEDVVESMEPKSTLPVINRYNHQRKVEITASPAGDVSQGEAIARCQQLNEKVRREVVEEQRQLYRALPQAASLLASAAAGPLHTAAAAALPAESHPQHPNPPVRDFATVELGNAQAMHETINSLVFALVLGIIIAYMILGVQFNSFVHPLTVLMAMPFAVTGALVTLWLTGDTLNMMSMIGLILLMGLVKKNSIILVDYTNQLRQEGMSVQDAVLAACPVRLRPILMTSVATVAGAVPAALGWGPGAETRAPMARGIIGGIVLSTLVTLVLVPVFYVLMERLRGVSGKVLVVPAEAEDHAPAPPPPAGIQPGPDGPTSGHMS
jgi:HAE1 family hydrophobic/amphiphilic exporter-1